MHELTIAQSLVDMAIAEARRHGASRVTGITCRIGKLRFVDDSLLREAFAVASEGGIAAAAILRTIPVGMTLTCPACGGETQLDSWQFDCPACDSPGVTLSGGDELDLCSLDVEVPDENPSASQESV